MELLTDFALNLKHFSLDLIHRHDFLNFAKGTFLKRNRSYQLILLAPCLALDRVRLRESFSSKIQPMIGFFT